MSKTESSKTHISRQQDTINAGQKDIQHVKGAFGSGKPFFKPATDKPDTSSSSGVMTRMEISQIPKAIAQFQPGVSKDVQIAAWLTGWISEGFANGSLHENMLLPLKKKLAEHLGVSVGTAQNAIRAVEDEGWVESKQRIGTMLRNGNDDHSGARVRKQTSKRDQAVLAIQQYIVKENCDIDTMLPSSREMAKVIKSAPNTTRLAMEYLAHEGILEAMGNRGKKPNWLLKQIPDVKVDHKGYAAIETDTLIDQLERDIKALIVEDYEVNSKLPSHQELAGQFNVSIKTIHDAMQRLVEQGIVHAKRGRYGSYVSRLPMNMVNMAAIEQFFVPVEAQQNFYFYEQAEDQLSKRVGTEFKQGEMLPSVVNLSEEMSLPVNAIRRALKSLETKGLVTFKRGRYGGTLVV